MNSDTESDPVFVFIDESGNFDFSDRGTRHFVALAHFTRSPLECGAALNALTYAYLANGQESQIPFHAAHNSSDTRREVLRSLCRREHACQSISLVISKRELNEQEHSAERLFTVIGLDIARRVDYLFANKEINIVLQFDSALTSKKRTAFLKGVKTELRKQKRQFRVLVRLVSHDVNGQIADFYSWSVFRFFESGDVYWIARLPGPLEIVRLKNDHPA